MAVLESSMDEKKSPKHSPNNKKKTILLAQDLNYARNLVANEEKVRNRSLKYLKKYLEQRSQASPLMKDNLKVLWKGLFYAMWMSDKPLVQEECAENIAHLIHCLQFDEAMLFFKIGLITLENEWIGVDQLRLDKFLMFVRRLLRQALFVLKKFNFRKHQNEVFAKVLEDTILSTSKEPPLGLLMHFTEIYLEEIAKVSHGKLQSSRTLDLLKPFIAKLAFTNDNRVIQWINKFIFTHLIKQHKLGLEYEDKYKIWKMHGFEGSINQIQKVVVSDDEWEKDGTDNEESEQSPIKKSLDPRAGRVDVELPQIPFSAKDIAEALLKPKGDARTSKNTRNHLTIWAERYQKLHNGIYPMGVKKLGSKKRKNLDNYDTHVDKAAKRLIKFEQQLLAKEGGKKRKRGDSEGPSKEGELDSAIPIKKTKNNVKTENTDKDNTSGTKKNHKKERPQQNKIIPKADKNITGIKEKSDKKSNNKAKLRESKITLGKNDLRNKIKDKKLKQKNSTYLADTVPAEEYFYSFERNSGVWYVTEESFDQDASRLPASDPLITVSTQGQSRRSSNGSSSMDALNESYKETTQANDNGRYGILRLSNKFVKKFKNANSDEEVEQVLSKLRGKSRTSLNYLSPRQNSSEITPKKRSPKPGSPKKVVINTKLNVSQEIDDHILQVISSPQVPWDSNRKPGKPLLKTPVKASPINPFYRLKTF